MAFRIDERKSVNVMRITTTKNFKKTKDTFSY